MLTYDQRQIIQKLYKERSQAAIAREIGVHRSTVKRELDRNSVDGEYIGHMAHIYTLARKRAAGVDFNNPPLRFRWHIRITPKRFKRPMLAIRKRIPIHRTYYKSDKVYGRIKRKRKEWFRYRYWRNFYKYQRYKVNRKRYFTEVRVRNYTREKFRKELLESIWGKRKYFRYSRRDVKHTRRFRDYAKMLAEARRRRELAQQIDQQHSEQNELSRPEEKNNAASQRQSKKNKLLMINPTGLAAEHYKEKLFEQESYGQIFVPPKISEKTAA